MFIRLIKCYDTCDLRNIIDQCQNVELELELSGKPLFETRSFPTKESGRPLVDKEMKKSCLLAILKKGMMS